eukprot:5671507-Prorocentrum_lima.AAC.1
MKPCSRGPRFQSSPLPSHGQEPYCQDEGRAAEVSARVQFARAQRALRAGPRRRPSNASTRGARSS